VHVEGADARHHEARDLAEADQPDGVAWATDAHQGQCLFLLEMSGAREAVGFDHAVGKCEEHPHRACRATFLSRSKAG
jgi:hypothetical protein